MRMRSRYARHAATKSPIASPPNFSCAARASSQATAASATTASASTAATSERSTSASAASPVARSTEPQRLHQRRQRLHRGAHDDLLAVRDAAPRSRPRGSSAGGGRSRSRRAPPSRACSASAKPSPISTPFTAWIPITAAASRASRRSSFAAYEPSPGGTSRARTSTTPPTVSRSARAASIAARRSSSSTVEPATAIPIAAQQRLRDAAGRDVHGRVPRRGALERVADVVVLVLEDARRGRRGRAAAASPASSPFPCGSPSGGHGLIPHVQFLWSLLRTTSASGVPSVRPWRSPASTSTRSCSICWRGERP